jgi:methionyl-tRNA formyltransferase
MLRIIFMGTPQFAVPALEALIKGAPPGRALPEGYDIVTVITRPDKPVGRGQSIIFSPVKEAALAHGIPVWQPGSFKRPENREALAAYHADLYIVAAFGQILPQEVLVLPRYGTLNIHASLLPKYRGVSPISEAILRGDTEAGVTIMLVDAGIDTGPMLLKRSIQLSEEETTGSLTSKLADLGARALLEVLPLWVSGKITPVPQDQEAASYTRVLRKEDGAINWQEPALVLARKIRAYTPWPGAYTRWRGKILKIHSAHTLHTPYTPPHTTPTASTTPGTVTLLQDAGRKSLAVTTGADLLVIKQLQLEGKKTMSVEEFLRGYPQIVGDTLAAT